MKTIRSLFAALAMVLLPFSVQALEVSVSPTPELGVEKTYTLTVTNDGDGFADDITAGELFGYGITLASEPTAEYFALFVRGVGEDSADENILKRIYVRSMDDYSLDKIIKISQFEDSAGNRGISDIEVNPKTGDIYVIFDDNSVNPEKADGGVPPPGKRFLYRVDLLAGTATKVGSLTDIYANDLAFDADGTLWAVGGCAVDCEGAIYTISLDDASADEVTDTLDGADVFGWEMSITYNPDDGLMYVFGEDALLTFDPANNASPWPGITLVEDDAEVLAPDGSPMDGIPGAGYIGDNVILFGSYKDEGIRAYNTKTNVQSTVVTDGVLGPDDGFMSTNGILPMGQWYNSLECTGSGDDLDCMIPRLIPGGKVKVSVTGTLYKFPVSKTAEPEPVTDTTVTEPTKGGGGCTVAADGNGSADMALLAFAIGAMILVRRRKLG